MVRPVYVPTCGAGRGAEHKADFGRRARTSGHTHPAGTE